MTRVTKIAAVLVLPTNVNYEKRETWLVHTLKERRQRITREGSHVKLRLEMQVISYLPPPPTSPNENRKRDSEKERGRKIEGKQRTRHCPVKRRGPGGRDPSHYVRGLIVMQKLEMANEMIEVSVSKATVRSTEAGLFVDWPRAA